MAKMVQDILFDDGVKSVTVTDILVSDWPETAQLRREKIAEFSVAHCTSRRSDCVKGELENFVGVSPPKKIEKVKASLSDKSEGAAVSIVGDTGKIKLSRSNVPEVPMVRDSGRDCVGGENIDDVQHLDGVGFLHKHVVLQNQVELQDDVALLSESDEWDAGSDCSEYPSVSDYASSLDPHDGGCGYSYRESPDRDDFSETSVGVYEEGKAHDHGTDGDVPDHGEVHERDVTADLDVWSRSGAGASVRVSDVYRGLDLFEEITVVNSDVEWKEIFY